MVLVLNTFFGYNQSSMGNSNVLYYRHVLRIYKQLCTKNEIVINESRAARQALKWTILTLSFRP